MALVDCWFCSFCRRYDRRSRSLSPRRRRYRRSGSRSLDRSRGRYSRSPPAKRWRSPSPGRRYRSPGRRYSPGRRRSYGRSPSPYGRRYSPGRRYSTRGRYSPSPYSRCVRFLLCFGAGFCLAHVVAFLADVNWATQFA